MLGFTILLVAGAALGRAAVFAPPYVQSREAYTHSKTYVSESLPPNTKDIYDPVSRKQFSFGILADVTAALVTANKSAPDYHPLLVVHKHVPHAWRNYKEIALKAQSLLNEASAKIRLMEDLIDNLCDAEGVTQCNEKVQAKVDGNPNAYKLPAELLLLLGKVSATVRRLQPKINSVTAERTEIPYLINNVQTQEMKSFVTDLEHVYKKLRQLQYRRFNSHIAILPYSDNSTVTPVNVAFGVLCGVTGRLVQASIVNSRQADPRALITQHAMYARPNYREVARNMNEILEEASRKVAPIIHLINTLCTPSSYFDCNGRIDARVLSDSYALRMPAKLFIHLGKLSKNIMRNQILIEGLVNNDVVVQYLSQHVNDASIDKFIKKMARTYTIMKMMGTVFI